VNKVTHKETFTDGAGTTWEVVRRRELKDSHLIEIEEHHQRECGEPHNVYRITKKNGVVISKKGTVE